MQLRHKLFIAIVFLTTMPLLVLQFGVVEGLEQEIRSRTEVELHGSLDKMSDELTLIINNQKSMTNGLARVPAVKRFASFVHNSVERSDEKRYQELAEELEHFFLNYQHSVPSIQALRFMDTSGKTLVKVKEGKPVEAKQYDPRQRRTFIADQSSKRFFQDAMRQADAGGVIMSDFELGQVALGTDFCPAMIRYTVPIRDEVDVLMGLLTVNVWGTRLDKRVEATIGSYQSNTYIVEMNYRDPVRDGIYLYHPETDKRFANQLKTSFNFANELTAEEWQSVRDSNKYGTLFRNDGQMLFYRKMSPYNDRDTHWLLVIEVASDKVFEPVNNMRRSIWLLLASLVIVSILVAIWASGRLAEPVQKLTQIIKRYADGERGARYQGAVNDEIGMAGHMFNYLAKNIESTEQEREKAVKAACQSERLAALGQLAAGIGHEINNPLMNIMSLASLIDESLLDEKDEVRSDIRILRKEGERCARIVQGILNFAREAEPSFKPFNMTDLLNETLELLRHRIDSSQIKLSRDIEDDLYIEGDYGLLQQVMVNVLLNAVQASPSGMTIQVSARRNEDKVIIDIVDQGVGIDDSSFSKLFDPFFTTKSEGEGTGLGLSVSYGIIKHHGGAISLENIKEGGVKAQIILPVEKEKSAISDDEAREPSGVAHVG